MPRSNVACRLAHGDLGDPCARRIHEALRFVLVVGPETDFPHPVCMYCKSRLGFLGWGEGFKWIVQHPLFGQGNRGSDSVPRYEGCGEKCILQPRSRAAEAARQILPNETWGKNRGILTTFSAGGTAS